MSTHRCYVIMSSAQIDAVQAALYLKGVNEIVPFPTPLRTIWTKSGTEIFYKNIYWATVGSAKIGKGKAVQFLWTSSPPRSRVHRILYAKNAVVKCAFCGTECSTCSKAPGCGQETFFVTVTTWLWTRALLCYGDHLAVDKSPSSLRWPPGCGQEPFFVTVTTWLWTRALLCYCDHLVVDKSPSLLLWLPGCGQEPFFVTVTTWLWTRALLCYGDHLAVYKSLSLSREPSCCACPVS
jgi:hypothetical protein